MTKFQLAKRYGASFDPYDRPITKPLTASVRVALDGVEAATASFSVDDLSGTVTFTAAPAAGVALTAGFEFDIPVRFLSDRLDIELDSFDAANAPSIPMIEVRE